MGYLNRNNVYLYDEGGRYYGYEHKNSNHVTLFTQ
jgi:hypothetical protein